MTPEFKVNDGTGAELKAAAVEESFSFALIDFWYFAPLIARFFSGFALGHLRVRTACEQREPIAIGHLFEQFLVGTTLVALRVRASSATRVK